ncbi:MAG: hypothetical protein ACI35O_01690 [Bacillaceae bacterium]
MKKTVAATIFSILDHLVQSAVMNKIVYKIQGLIVVNPHFYDWTSTCPTHHF